MTEAHPKLVEELVPKLMSLGEVQKVLQQLLREQVSIRDLGSILEVMVEAAGQSKNIVHLVESMQAVFGTWAGASAARCRGWVAGADDRERAGVGDGEHVRPSAFGVAAGRWWAGRACSDRVPQAEADRVCETANRRASATATPVLLCPSPARYHMCGAGWSRLFPR